MKGGGGVVVYRMFFAALFCTRLRSTKEKLGEIAFIDYGLALPKLTTFKLTFLNTNKIFHVIMVPYSIKKSVSQMKFNLRSKVLDEIVLMIGGCRQT